MPLYAGFDCSTQSLSVVVIDVVRRTVVFRDSLPFAEPFLTSPDASVVHAAPRMWAAALDEMLGRMAANIDRASLEAISGAAQQHGSVYCGSRPEDFTRETSPIWMDSSTGRECADIEQALGGADGVAQLTGSRTFPRFTGPQVRKFWREEPEAYARTERIHLVSSFLASLLIGRHAPIDHADGSGMNLMNIRTGQWAPAALDATAPGLHAKLPPLVPSSSLIGTLSSARQQRFALPPVQIAAWSGDNPSSMVGTGLIREGQLAISLGTSDTIFGPMQAPDVSRDGTGHVFGSPLGTFMGITVFRNGSLARERVRDAFGLSWAEVDAALRQTPTGNDGAMMLPWFEAEITPSVAAASPVRVGLDGVVPARHVRALVEGQMMAMKRHSVWMGVAPASIRATGGASANRSILQVMADVFGVPVDVVDNTGSAALGAALRACQAHSRQPWSEIIAGFTDPDSGTRIMPIAENVTIYRTLQPRYIALEHSALAGGYTAPAMNIGEIAKRAKVSTATVSRTLNQSGPVKAATARKVWRAVTALNYYPNSHARALVSGRSRLIGLIVSDITNPFFPELIRAFEGLAAQKQYDLLMTSTDYDTTRMTTCLRRMLERKVDGVAMMTSEMDAGMIKELSRRNVPIVFMDVGQVGPRMSHVSIDYGHGVRQGVDHVIGLGHKHVAFITGPLELHSARTRRQAFIDGIRHHGLRLEPKMIREGTHTAEGGEKAMRELLKLSRIPTAVICSNDWTAIGALHAVHAAGLRVPDDLSLVGFDDIPMSSYITPALTTVRMSARDVGTTAFQALFSLIGEEHVEGDVYQVPTRLVVRESTAKPRKR